VKTQTWLVETSERFIQEQFCPCAVVFPRSDDHDYEITHMLEVPTTIWALHRKSCPA